MASLTSGNSSVSKIHFAFSRVTIASAARPFFSSGFAFISSHSRAIASEVSAIAQLLECAPAFDGDGSFDSFVAWTWQVPAGERLLIAVNFSAQPGQCYVRLAFAELSGAAWLLADLLGDARYERDGDELQSRGLYLNVGPWQCHVFEMSPSRRRPHSLVSVGNFTPS